MCLKAGNTIGKQPGPLGKSFFGHANDGTGRYYRCLVLFELEKRPKNVKRLRSVRLGAVGVNAEHFPNFDANEWKGPIGCDDER